MSFGANKVLDDVNFDLRSGEIHSLMGQNGAGKSTLIKILNGIYQPISGEIELFGKAVHIKTPKEAQLLGMSFVHQELNVCEYLTVAENMYIGNLPKTKIGLYDRKETIAKAKKLLDDMEIEIDPCKNVRELRNAEKQIVEIIKALTRDAKILIMDEPTSSLNEREKENFFRIVRKLKNNGVSIIFISHFLEDVIELSDRVTVIKDGVNNGVFLRDELNKDALIVAMMGKKIDRNKHLEESALQNAPVVLEVKNLCSRKKLNNISFSVRQGSVIGVCGLLGAGKTEIARAVFGLDDLSEGEIYINGELIRHPTPAKMMENNVVYLSEDRKKEGFVPLMSIKENITLSISKLLKKKNGFLDRKRQSQLAQRFADKVMVKMESIDQAVSKLSGGNQQKVIIARCLATGPKLFLLDEPTRGVDVFAKSEIYKILQEAAEQGMAVLVFSSELEELLDNCSEIIVLKKGEIVSSVRSAHMTKNDLLNMIG